jgi:GNAT superfamily N-acetyltransferase
MAVIELDVHKEYRRQGIGKRLLDTLLSDRGERYATLACLTDSPEREMYVRWEWCKVATFEDLPPMDAMLILLNN